MILFSVLIALSENLASCFPAVQILLPVLEITNGIQLIGMSAVSFPVKYILALSLTAFGGICAAAQTQCMIQKPVFNLSLHNTKAGYRSGNQPAWHLISFMLRLRTPVLLPESETLILHDLCGQHHNTPEGS